MTASRGCPLRTTDDVTVSVGLLYGLWGVPRSFCGLGGARALVSTESVTEFVLYTLAKPMTCTDVEDGSSTWQQWHRLMAQFGTVHSACF